MWTEAMLHRRERFPKAMSVGVFVARAALVCGIIAAVGCSRGGPPTGTLQGDVTIRGEKLAAGQLCVISKAGAGAVAAVADGTYRFTDPLPVGEYTAWLEPPARDPGGTSPAAAGVDDATWQRWVPRGVRAQSSSPLRLVVEPGPNSVPIEIAD